MRELDLVEVAVADGDGVSCVRVEEAAKLTWVAVGDGLVVSEAGSAGAGAAHETRRMKSKMRKEMRRRWFKINPYFLILS
jgi:hypothetical protein